MKRENNKKIKKRRRNQKRNLTCRALSMIFAIVLFCSTVLVNTSYVSQASSFDDMVDMVEIEDDSEGVDTYEETGDDFDIDVNFESEESPAEACSESEELGSGDADFSSIEDTFTDGSSESSVPSGEAQPVSCIVNLKNDTIEIKAEAPAGVLPDGTQMIVKAVENNTEDAELTDQYNKLAAKITEQLQSQSKNLDGFLAYNVSFTDADGNPVEPAGKVNYSFTYKEASSPELTDPAASTVTAAMIRTNKETSELELTELKAEADQLTVETNESRQLTRAAFQSAATAAFTFVWSSTPAADDNENNENKEENGEVNNEEVNADTNTENTEENGEEAPDQTQIKMIRIIADEVNLRVAPSTEADVIATVDTDTELPLLETVTGEDEFTWYKVSYNETEAYVRSDMAEVVETEEQGTENEDANEEEAEVQIEEVTYSQTIDNVVVTATAAKGVLPADAQFVVTPIKSEDAQYEDIAARLEEKAENEEYSIAGFLAYDIYFLNSAGEKINPEDGKVKISMEYQNATAPEEVKESDTVQMEAEEEETSQENTEAKELSVSVMHFVEENGEVTSVVDMTKENSAAVETNEAGEVQKAEFETESFSTFTITWKYSYWNTYYKNLRVHLVYQDNNEYVEIPGTANKYNDVLNDSDSIELSELGKTYKATGYTYLKALAKDKETQIAYISYNSNSNGNAGWFWADENRKWTYLKNNDNSYDIYLVYDINSGVLIMDKITTDGALEAKYKPQDETAQTTVASYEWYKSDSENGEYTKVEKVNYKVGAAIESNISEDGTKLYPAYDDGARKWYKVKATLSDSDSTSVESLPYQVPYYNQLQNGSFETPQYAYYYSNQVSNATYAQSNGVWQTTGTNAGRDIEIVRQGLGGGDGAYAWWTDKDNRTDRDEHAWSNAAYDGTQFAELNCEAAGALYQDVLTQKGVSLNYWLAHRARGDKSNEKQYDTMYLVIMPKSAAVDSDGNELTTQTQLNEFLKSKLGNNFNPDTSYSTEESKELYNQDGIKVLRVTSTNQRWQYINEIGKYTATSSLTRFFFMSGATASNNNTVGNFLDQVGFSQELPPVAEDEFTLQIKKSFEGLGSTDIDKVKNNIRFNIEVTKNNQVLSTEEVKNLLGDEVETDSSGKPYISGSRMTLQGDGNLVYTFTNRKIVNGTTYNITVTESNAEQDGYSLTTTTQTSTQIGENNPKVVENSTTATLQSKATAIVSFTNKYEENNYKNINFTKIWDDANNKYSTRPDSLDVTLSATYTVSENGTTQTKPLDLTDKVTPSVTIQLNSNNNWKCSWRVPVYHKLDNGTKVKIKYTVKEGENSSDYVYTATTDENGNAIAGDGKAYTTQFNDSKISTPTTSKKAAKKNVISRMSVGLTNLFSDEDATATTSDTNTSNSNELGEPAHRKYIIYNEDTADYTLNLDVTGAKGSKPGVDVLFVIDTSGSMGSRYNNLLPKVKQLLTKENGIVDKIFAKNGNVNSVAMVSFAGKDETKTTDWYSNSEKGTFEDKVNALNATGGTNWTYAMIKAQEVMNQRKNSSNEKVVIFLSDGEPTYSYKNGRQTGRGNYTDESYYEDAAAQVTGSLSDAKIYSVYLTSGTKDGMETFSQKVKNSELVDGTSLDRAMTEILNKVIPTYKNVIITDQLSQYVDFAEAIPTITVTKKTAAGASTTLNQGDYIATINGKTVTVQLLSGGSLEDGATYTISFKVKPSDAANQYYAEKNSYPDTGDPDTGSTSAGKAGFYSNDDSATKLQYEIDGISDGTQTASYKKPVVQVTTHTLTYTKTWYQPNSVEAPQQDVVLHVTYTDGAKKDITLTKEDGYTLQEIVPVTRKIANITEEPVTNYDPSYVISEDGTSATVTNNYSKVTASSITVKKKWVGNGPITPITVNLYRSTDNGEAEIYDAVQLDGSNDWKYTWSQLPQSEGTGTSLTTYTYAVKEKKIPANYSSSITYEEGTDSITATITNTYDENCADENYYIANVLQTENLYLTKTWDDNDNAAGLRPKELNVTVDGVSYTLTSNGNWTKEVTILKKKTAPENASENEPENYDLVGTSINRGTNGVEVSFKNKLKSKSITVSKAWNDENVNDRPKSVSFVLMYSQDGGTSWTKYDEYSITEEDNNGTNWTRVINNLPSAFTYKVVEISQYDNYSSTVTSSGDTFTITNTLKWSAVKKSADDNSIGLSGAEFELKQGDEVIATGKSGDGGVITWSPTSGDVNLYALDGMFNIYETKAPAGYMKNDSGWTVVFENGLLKSLDGAESSTEDGAKIKASAATGVVITLTNQKVYTLPSTGGSGIYWYMISGMVLMSAAAWILYKNKCKEVLGK